MTTAVLFDLDRTLVRFDVEPIVFFERAIDRAGVEASEEALGYFQEQTVVRFKELADDPFLAAARDAREESGLDADPAALSEALKDEVVGAGYVPGSVRETVAGLTADHPLGVVTNGYGPVQRRKLESTGLAGHFETVVTPDGAGVFKPEPAIFQAAQERMPADRYVFVGDSAEYDLEPAAELGFRTVLVGDGDPGPADLHLPEPEDFGQIPEFVAHEE